LVGCWKKKKAKTSKFLDAGNNNWDEGIINMEWIKREEWSIKMKLKL
jgi:hypothetical protein